ncbi:MAG: homoserine kinase [Saprospiraceae bacterium]|nr:homoserine kinase [Saprospiraceae bacterium]
METTAFAPASIGNIGVGFDIMGLALHHPGDEVTARFTNKPGITIGRITGDGGKLPLDPAKNTAAVAARVLLEQLGETGRGIELDIHKKMPFGSGLGSSSASAVAAVVAVNALLGSPRLKYDLLHAAVLGDQAATGAYITDNAAPSLLGGIVLIRDGATLDVHNLPVPPGLYATVVYPHVEVLTKNARAVLKPDVPMPTYIRQSANVAAFVTALYKADYALLGRCLRDDVVEPQRAGLIPGFYDVKEAAMTAGALGCSISGAGPSVFALSTRETTAQQIGEAMMAAFGKHGIKSELFVSLVNEKGAEVIP